MGLSTDDKVEIQELVARYCHAIDGGRPEAWADTFTADGVFHSPRGEFKGREALIKFAQERAATGRAVRHWTNNHVIEGDGDRATLTCYFTIFNVKDGTTIGGSGIYRDTVQRVNGAWRFSQRTVTSDA